MNEEGIKFECRWLDEKPLEYKWLKELNTWRSKLFSAGLIGVYPDGIGYGNMSIRFQRSKFIITGTATGKLLRLNSKHYTVVKSFNLEKNRLLCEGPIKASSESLTHAVLYECSPDVNAVFHVHNREMWQKLMNKVPSTKKNIEYGTVEMAREIQRLYRETNLFQEKILVMAGHEEGIIAFGKNCDEAGEKLLRNFSPL